MPPELAPWISPAVIVGFMLYFNRRLERRMDRMESRMDRLESQIGDLRIHVDAQIGELRERMAHLEGLLEGLREAITHRNVA